MLLQQRIATVVSAVLWHSHRCRVSSWRIPVPSARSQKLARSTSLHLQVSSISMKPNEVSFSRLHGEAILVISCQSQVCSFVLCMTVSKCKIWIACVLIADIHNMV